MSRTLLLTACLTICGCVYIDDSPQGTTAPLPTTRKVARYMPPADQYVKSKLIDFDSPYDTSFVVASGIKLIDDPDKAGNRVMIAPGATIKLGALVRGREFPGPWDLLGVRVRADRQTGVKLTLTLGTGESPCESDSNAGPHWEICWIELSKLPTSMPIGTEQLLTINSVDGKPILIDEVILAQSRTVVSQSTVPGSGESWRVGRTALRWQVFAGEHELLSLPAAPFVEEGYRVLESNAVRTVFISPTDTISIDRNGRLIENGAARLDERVVKFAKTTAENDSPAMIEIPPDQGRVERTLPGDRDNDGYDESRGCYTIRSTASRLSVRLSPQKFPVSWPVIEVIGLPPGAVSVWLEGQIVPWVTRLSDGKTIIELPVKLQRPIEAQVRVK